MRESVYPSSEKDSIKAIDDSLNDMDLVPSEKDHYVWMEKVFIKDWMWTWIINLITYIAVIAIYCCTKG